MKNMRKTLFVICLSALLIKVNAQSVPWTTPAEWKMRKNPVAAETSSTEKGKKNYLTLCSPCHGEKGKGNGPLAITLNPKPANHSSSQFQQQKDGEIFYKIVTGRNAMPQYKQVLTEVQVWNIVNYIRSLEEKTKVKTNEKIEGKIKQEAKQEEMVKKMVPVKITNDIALSASIVNPVTVLNPVRVDSITSETVTAADAASSQNADDAKRKFMLTGSAHFNIISGGSKFNFDSTGFNIGFLPVFLWKPTKRLFFEAHLHIAAGGGNAPANQNSGGSGNGSVHLHGKTGGNIPVILNGGTNASTSSSSTTSSGNASSIIMLSYANLVYFIHDYVIFTGGLFLSPFGIYSERFHPEWINTLPDAPLGLGHSNQFAPETELGFQLRGGFPIGKIKANYSIYVSNGPSLIDTGMYAGKLSYDNLNDNNTNKALGGRVGILPLPNSTVEVGFSAQRARVGNDTTLYEGVDALLYAADISYHNSFYPIHGAIDIKGQYTANMLDKVYYKADPNLTLSSPANDVNLNDSTYRFENASSAYFLMAAYRPVMSGKFIRNFEFIFRYDAVRTPNFARWKSDESRWSAGIAYWLESRSAFKLAYLSGQTKKLMVFQFVIGL